MEKKAYIAPTVTTYQLHAADGLLQSLSGGDILGNGGDSPGGLISDAKGSGDWDIWGNGSDDDYDDEY